MITNFLFSMLAGIVTGLFSLLPSFGADTSTVTSMSNWGTVLGSANGYVPENMLIVCLGIIVAVRLWFFLIDGILFVYRLIPFNG